MKLFLLLGNVGNQYRLTRHNAAWLLCDLAFSDLDWSDDPYHKSFVAGEGEMVFAKPLTLMNLSGDALHLLMKKYNISKQEASAGSVIVAHDDVDIPIGEIKLSKLRGDGNNNGVKSVQQIVGKEVLRIRIGVGEKERSQKPRRALVLEKFTEEELETLAKLAPKFFEMVNDIAQKGETFAMNKWNKKGK